MLGNIGKINAKTSDPHTRTPEAMGDAESCATFHRPVSAELATVGPQHYGKLAEQLAARFTALPNISGQAQASATETQEEPATPGGDDSERMGQWPAAQSLGQWLMRQW